MKKINALAATMLAAVVSTQALAIDITNPFNHVTQPQLSAAVQAGADAVNGLRAEGAAAVDQLRSEGTAAYNQVQGQLADGQGQINDLKAQGAAVAGQLNDKIDGVASAGAAAIGQTNTAVKAVDDKVNAAIGAQSGINSQVNDHINAVQGAAQAANEKADAGAVRMDGIEGSLANTDNRSINNAVRLDAAENGIRETNGAVQAVNADLQGAKEHQSGVNQQVQGQITTITDVNSAQQVQINTNTATNTRQDTQINNLQSYAADMDQRLGGRLDSQQSQINSLKRDTKQAKEAAAGALAVAGQQFSTDKSAGFQAAISAATIGGEQAIAIGAGGAITENVFINAAFTKAGSTTGGVVSGTYRFK